MTERCKRLLEPLELVVFIDAIFVKVRGGEVSNRPMYAAIGVGCRQGSNSPQAFPQTR
jgi:transposase-like protein